MDVEEFELALTDLETRMDRLRALYENWFRGYEKSEPTVARKDVERRVYGLRKLLPRNTALRFRYHQLYHRYTTLTSYWQRTARQVEEGTYRLQLQRMRRKNETVLASKRPDATAEGEEGKLEPRSYELSLDETLDVSQLLDDFELDQVASAIDSPGAYRDAQARAAGSGAAPLAEPPLPTAPDGRGTPIRVEAPAPPELAKAKPSIGVFSKPGNSSRESLPNASLPAPHPSEPTATRALPNAPRTSAESMPREAALLAGGARVANQNAMIAPSVGVASSGAGSANSEAQSGASKHGLPSPARPNIGGGTGAMPAPPRREPLAGEPRMSTPTGTMTAPPRRDPPLVEPPPRPVPPRAPPPAPGAQPSSRASVPSSIGGARPQVPPPPPARPAESGSISDQQIRRIYDEYVAARRKNNEGDVRFETLAGSINKMLPDLQKKHQGKRIDFEVVLKDGRVGLKPKAT